MRNLTKTRIDGFAAAGSTLAGYLSLVAVFTIAFGLGIPTARAQTEDANPDSESSTTVADAPAEPTGEAEPARPDLSEASDLVRQGDYAGAASVLESLQEEFPDDPGLLLMRGEVVLALGKPAEALPLLRRCAELDPDRPRVHFQMAAAQASTGDIDGALESFAREIEVNEDVAVRRMSHVNRSLLLQDRRRWGDAAGELEALLALEPESTEIHGELIAIYLKAERLDDALRALERAEAAGFQSAPVFFNVGARLYNEQLFEQAEKIFARVLEIDPQMAAAERSLGSVLTRLEREEEAAEHYRRYLELRPDASDAAQIREQIEAAAR